MSNRERVYIIAGSFLAIVILCFGLTYLLWSFMHADFNFWKWGGFSRAVMVIVSIFLTAVCVCIAAAFLENNTEILDFDL